MNQVSRLTMHGYTFVIGDYLSIIEAMFNESKMQSRSCLVITPNLSIWGSIEKKPELNFIKKASDFHLPDGWPIALALSIKYRNKIDRITGSDLLPELFSYCSRMGNRMAIIGGHDGYDLKLSETLAYAHLSLQFKIFNETALPTHKPISNEIISKIREFQPDVIAVCLGFPKQEYVALQLQEFFVLPILCLGASLDFAISPHLRAPNFMILMKLEWFWRLLHEPSRLFKRYFSEALYAIPSLLKAIVK